MNDYNDARRQAGIWTHNRDGILAWARGYAKRTNSTPEDVMRDRMSNWIHDEHAEVVGTFDGYKLSVCPMSNDVWRYTVVMPWLENEGLCDTDGRDDDFAIRHLRDVISHVIERHEDPAKPVTAAKKPAKQPQKPKNGVRDAGKKRRPITTVSSPQKADRTLKVGTIGMRMAGKTAWHLVNDEYVPEPIWLKGNRRYYMSGKEFIPLSRLGECIVAESGHCPMEVRESILRRVA